MYQIPIQQWIAEGANFGFIGDNVNKLKRVRDQRSDNQSEMVNMYSVLVAKSRVSSQSFSKTGVVADLNSIPCESFLPSHDDVHAVKQNLVVLVCRLLCTFFKDPNPLSKSVPAHIPHKFSKEMEKKSEDAVIDVLLKDETRHDQHHGLHARLLGKELSRVGKNTVFWRVIDSRPASTMLFQRSL